MKITVGIDDADIDHLEQIRKGINSEYVNRSVLIRRAISEFIGRERSSNGGSIGGSEGPGVCMSCHPGNMGCEHCLHGTIDPDVQKMIVCRCKCKKSAAAMANVAASDGGKK